DVGRWCSDCLRRAYAALPTGVWLARRSPEYNGSVWRGGLLVLWLLAPWASPAAAQETVDISVDTSGHYVAQFHSPEMTFRGGLGMAPSNVRTSDGDAGVGTFHRLEFDYGGRTSRITAYSALGAVVFYTDYTASNLGVGAFPTLRQLPQLPYKLSYHDTPFSP